MRSAHQKRHELIDTGFESELRCRAEGACSAPESEAKRIGEKCRRGLDGRSRIVG